MELIEKIDKVWDVIASIARKIAAVLLLVMIFVVSIQVIGRLARLTIPWTEEVGTYSLIWMVFIGSVAVLIKNEHLTVDLFLLRYTPKMRRTVTVFIDLFILAFCVVLFIFGVKLCMSPIVINGRTPALAVSRLVIYLSMPIAMGFSSLFSVYAVIRSVYDLASGGKLRPIKENPLEVIKP